MHDGVNSFSQTREILGGWVRQRVTGAYDRILDAADTSFVHGVVMATALSIAALIVAGLVAPAGFAAFLATMPTPWLAGQSRPWPPAPGFADMGRWPRRRGRHWVVVVAQMFEPWTEEEVVAAVQAEQPKKVKAQPTTRSATVVTEQVVEEVHVITDVAEPATEVVPGVTPITEENRVAEREGRRGRLPSGPGKHKPKRK